MGLRLKLVVESASDTLCSRPSETRGRAAQAEVAWETRNHVHAVVMTAVTILGIYLCYRMAMPFLPAIVWAVALAVLFAPAQRWLETKLRHANVAALIAVAMIGLIVVVPASFVGRQLVLQAADATVHVAAKVSSGEWQRAIDEQPKLVPVVDWINHDMDLPGTFKAVAAWASTTAGAFVGGSVIQVVEICITFYVLFYLLRDRRQTLVVLAALSPLTKAEMRQLLGRVIDTIYATVYGTLAVAAIQGLLGGLMFWWLGVSAPLLWGVVMALLAVVPVLGAFVVWIPAAVFLALEGHWGKAVILALWGMFVVGTIDNLLRPILVGTRLKLHTILAFMSVVGGLMLFGQCGLILGPVTLTFTMVLLEIWAERARLAAQSSPQP